MFRIRKILDSSSRANQDTLAQIEAIMREQFPLATETEIKKLPGQLDDPLRYKFKTVIFVAEDARGRVKGFALLLHMTDVQIAYLEFISVAPGKSSRGIGGILYERVREEVSKWKVDGIIFECLPDEAHLTDHPELLEQNKQRLRFYERYGARPILNRAFGVPIQPDRNDLFFLVLDDLGSGKTPSRKRMRLIVREILERKYGKQCTEEYIQRVLATFNDDPVVLRPYRYIKSTQAPIQTANHSADKITLIINDRHDIHHVRDRGYVEAPVRIKSILTELNKLNIFRTVEPKKYGEKAIRRVHDKDYVKYLRQACESLQGNRSLYPSVFPIRNNMRPPKDLDMQVGYYCIDTFTPLNHNAYLAAQRAVDCAMTGAELVLDGERFCYALVRPPGHHAERRAFGGFCYFNSAAIAADFLSDYGKVVVLDIDYHHGNGTQDIFYKRDDVLTISIHGDPHLSYPYFSGFKDEIGEDSGKGFNINYPLPDHIDGERYRKTLHKALKDVNRFKPDYLVVSLGLDTARNDPTGTWQLIQQDFFLNGKLIAELGYPTLFVQEGGYNNRNLGSNAREFFQGVWASYASVNTKAKI
jgi:acetoin utilization deacetylase AcuC-like enzyme/GNAT superfamily N-acetyltransferase